MDEIKTDLFPENLRAARNDMGKQETGVARENQAASMKAGNEYAGAAKAEDEENGKSEDEYAETMTPAEPLPGPERPV